jgi:curli biogenesis system outer membrane secretion channel CsgG
MADYVAYSVSENDRKPLPANIDGIEPQYLVNLDWGKYTGPRARLGVLEVDNTSTAGSYHITGPYVAYETSHGGQVPVNGIEAIIIDVLNRTARFRLVERQALGSVLAEQDLATGNVLGAEYLVQAVVTNYEPGTEGKDVGVGALARKIPLLGGVKFKSRKGVVGMNFRLINAETSEIEFTKQVDTQIDEKGLTFGGAGFTDDLGLGGFMSSFSKTPIGQAVIAAVNEGVFELIKQVGSQSATGSVIKADTQEVYVNLGEDRVTVGDTLQVLSKGEELIDPDTGISLGVEESVLGNVQVFRVAEKFSVARPVNLGATPSRGDKVRSTKPPPALEFASSWKKPK